MMVALLRVPKLRTLLGGYVGDFEVEVRDVSRVEGRRAVCVLPFFSESPRKISVRTSMEFCHLDLSLELKNFSPQ